METTAVSANGGVSSPTIDIPRETQLPASFRAADFSFAKMLLTTRNAGAVAASIDDEGLLCENDDSFKPAFFSGIVPNKVRPFIGATSAPPLPSLASLTKSSVKIGGTQYRLVLPGAESLNPNASTSPSVRASTPQSSTPTSRPDAAFAKCQDSAVSASAAFLRATTPVSVATSGTSAEKAELNAAEWSLPVDGWQLKKIETLMNSRTLRKSKRSSSDSIYQATSNKQPEIMLPSGTDRKIFIVFPDSKDVNATGSDAVSARKALKFVMQTKFTNRVKTTTTTATMTKKAHKIPKHRLRKCGEGPSPPKMFSKAAVQRNVLYMKSGDKLGYKKMKKSSCDESTGCCCSCPLKNKQYICHPEVK